MRTVFEIDPPGLTHDDLAAIHAQVACSPPGSNGGVWHYSASRRVVLVGVIRDRRLVLWLMQPATTEAEAERVAGRWWQLLGTAEAVRSVLAAVGAADAGSAEAGTH